MNETELLTRLLYDLENIKKAVGRIEKRQCKDNSIFSLDNEFKVYSQWGEDGIIQWLINNLQIDNKIFVEFGVEDYEESNTRFLLENDNWSGLVFDGSSNNIEYIKHSNYYWKYNLKAEKEFITKENINHLLKTNGIEGNIGILSIDIDGNDYWVWQEINVITPDIVIVEYNSLYGKEKKITIPYFENFVRQKYNYTYLIFGASIAAFVELGAKKGYSLVAGNNAGNNLFFVKDSLCNNIVKRIEIDDAYRKSKFREMRDEQGNLTFASFDERLKSIKEAKVWNIEKRKIEKIKDIVNL